jgi:hypothetical protein
LLLVEDNAVLSIDVKFVVTAGTSPALMCLDGRLAGGQGGGAQELD